VPRAASAPEWGRALLVALFPLQGFEVVPVLSGSAKRAQKSVLAATLGALVFAALVYALIQAACAGAVPALAESRAPLAEAAAALGGAGYSRVVALGASVSALGIAFGMFVMTPRYLAALGDHSEAVAFLKRPNSRGVPVFSVLVTFAAVVLLALFESLESLFVLSSSAVLVQYVAASSALVRLALKREHGFRPGAALPAVLALGAIGLLSRAVQPKELVVLGGLLVLGAVLLLASGRSER
jgi:amino acid transporter